MRLPLLLCLLATASASLWAQQGPQPIGEVQGADATVRGAVTVGASGTMVMSGSQVTAGATAANIKLTRGGELKVCSGASITITASASGHEALVGLSHGTIETHYRLASNADTIVTPDFRLSLPGPGDFHFAIGMKSSGDMCVKSLPGNSSAMIVNEVFGEGTHQVRPGDAVLFQHGTVQGSAALPPDQECGCPAAKAELGFPEQQSQRAAAAIAAGEAPPQTTPLPGVTTKKDEVITKVDAPIVFRGEEPQKKEPPAMSPAAPSTAQPAAPTAPPKAEAKPAETAQTATAKPAKKKWYQKLGSAIANLFR